MVGPAKPGAAQEEYLELLVIKLVDADVMTIDEAKSGFPELSWVTPDEVDDIRHFAKKQS